MDVFRGKVVVEVLHGTYDMRGEVLAQGVVGWWWFGTQLPCVSKMLSDPGDRPYPWWFCMRLPWNRELSIRARERA